MSTGFWLPVLLRLFCGSNETFKSTTYLETVGRIYCPDDDRAAAAAVPPLATILLQFASSSPQASDRWFSPMMLLSPQHL
ncbi:hypothetical protein C8R45DRAFT_1006472 [Mycena sanguinolenta]|nr:hypothetical protein C8R45DRAFT_1006472 [Mycena sanguinolenta]